MNTRSTRERVEMLLVGLASGRKMEDVLKGMGITLKQARRMLRGKIGREVLEEVREVRVLQRELTGKKAEEKAVVEEEEVLGVGELPAGVTEEEVREAVRRNAEL